MPSVFVTWMSLTVAAASAGAVTVMLVSFVNVTFDPATPPNVTAAPATKCVPVSVTVTPPAGGPDRGEES